MIKNLSAEGFHYKGLIVINLVVSDLLEQLFYFISFFVKLKYGFACRQPLSFPFDFSNKFFGTFDFFRCQVITDQDQIDLVPCKKVCHLLQIDTDSGRLFLLNGVVEADYPLLGAVIVAKLMDCLLQSFPKLGFLLFVSSKVLNLVAKLDEVLIFLNQCKDSTLVLGKSN